MRGMMTGQTNKIDGRGIYEKGEEGIRKIKKGERRYERTDSSQENKPAHLLNSHDQMVGYPDILLWFIAIQPSIFQDSTMKCVMASLFHNPFRSQ